MTQLVFKSTDGQPVTNSILVAEKFEKNHRDVLKAIRELITSAQNCAHLFAECEYPDAYGRDQPMFIMNRDGFSLLVMGFTGQKALNFKLDFIEAFNTMEKQAKALYIPRTYSEALRFAATQIEEKEALQHQIAMNAPKLAIASAFESSTGVCSVAELAHILTQNGYDTGERKLFIWLRDNGYLCKRRDVWNQPTQYSIDKGLFEIKRTLIEHSNGTSEVRNTSKVTIKGQTYFIKLLTGNNQPTKSLPAC